MVHYRRNFVPGGSYFFTVNLRDRQLRLLTDHIVLLRQAFRVVRQRHPFEITAIVVLPEHIHALWRLPDGDHDYPNRWRGIKRHFTESLAANDLSRIWQDRYWEHTIRDETDLQRHIDYIHINPVKHGWVTQVADWPYSSFHRYVAHERLPRDWAGRAVDGVFGE